MMTCAPASTRVCAARASPRHVPDAIEGVSEIPHTLSGKKLEVPVKRILVGMPVERALTLASVANPGSLQFFIEYAAKSPTNPPSQT